MSEKQKLIRLAKDKEHKILRNILHNVQSSSSYRIGNTQIICGISTEIKQLIQDGQKPKIFNVHLNQSGLCKEQSPMISTLSQWIEEVFNDEEIFKNKNKLIIETEDKQTCFYQKIHIVLYVIDDDGNVFDVSFLATLTALMSLYLNEMIIGIDGLCSFDLKNNFKLEFNYHPIPFNFVMMQNDTIQSYFSFILTEQHINHIHIHGGNAVFSSDLLTGCIQRSREFYDSYKKRLFEQ